MYYENKVTKLLQAKIKWLYFQAVASWILDQNDDDDGAAEPAALDLRLW